jgi:hypothetical protein
VRTVLGEPLCLASIKIVADRTLAIHHGNRPVTEQDPQRGKPPSR